MPPAIWNQVLVDKKNIKYMYRYLQKLEIMMIILNSHHIYLAHSWM